MRKSTMFAVIWLIFLICIVINIILSKITYPFYGEKFPPPKDTYGEFPFTLIYEINGEKKTIKDTVICEFGGYGYNKGSGKFSIWESYLASGKKRITLLKIDEYTEIYYKPGGAKYYMGYLKNYAKYKHDFPNARYLKKNPKTGKIKSVKRIGKKKLYNKYNIRLIEWDYTPPIKVSFGSMELEDF